MRVALTLLALSIPLGAAAQRTGLPVDSIAFAGTQRTDIDASDPHGAVRVTFSGSRTIQLDVRVEATSAAAHAALQDIVRTTAGELPSLQIGEGAFGDDTYVAFVRENIVVVVRSDAARSDAQALDRLIGQAPRGTPNLDSVQVTVPQLEPGTPTAVEFPRDVLSAHLVVRGPATARKTRSGWVVTRTGAGEIRFETSVCDALLRRR